MRVIAVLLALCVGTLWLLKQRPGPPPYLQGQTGLVARDLGPRRPLMPAHDTVALPVVAQDDFPKLRERDRVDVLVTLRDTQTQQLLTRTLLIGAQVLGVLGGEVWLEVLPEEAELLVQAKRQAVLGLTRRNPDDCEDVGDLQDGRATAESMLRNERTNVFKCRGPRTLTRLTPKK